MRLWERLNKIYTLYTCVIGIQENLFNQQYPPNTPNVKAKHLKRITIAFALRFRHGQTETHTHTHTHIIHIVTVHLMNDTVVQIVLNAPATCLPWYVPSPLLRSHDDWCAHQLLIIVHDRLYTFTSNNHTHHNQAYNYSHYYSNHKLHTRLGGGGGGGGGGGEVNLEIHPHLLMEKPLRKNV